MLGLQQEQHTNMHVYPVLDYSLACIGPRNDIRTGDTREVSLYVITYENPCVVRAGERGQLSYVNLSTDFRRKAVSYVGSSVGLFEIFIRIFRICPWQG